MKCRCFMINPLPNTKMLLPLSIPFFSHSFNPSFPKNLPFKRTQALAYSCFSSLLDLCTKPELLRQIHARFLLHGLHQNPTLSSKLIDCYSKLGQLDVSQKIFDIAPDPPDAILYNTLIRNLSLHGKLEKILFLYHQMFVKAKNPDEITYSCIIKSLTNHFSLENGKKVHCHVLKFGYETLASVATCLLELYAKCGKMADAQRIFEGMPERNLGVWNILISGFSLNGLTMETFLVHKRMRLEGVEPNSAAMVSLLQSCVDLRWLDAGRYIHLLIIVGDLHEDLWVNTALLTMYSKLGGLEMAQLVFEKIPEKDCAVWNLMITAYSQNFYPGKALELLIQMGKSGIRTDLFTAITTISSAAEMKLLKQGKQIHAHVVRNGSDYQVSVHNSLIEMYSKCGNLDYANKIFDSLLNKTVVSWSTIIRAYLTHHRSADAFSLYKEMKMASVKLDSITVINVLPACVQMGAVMQVKNLHGYSIKQGLNSIPSLATALLVSYAKCGCIQMAQKLFKEESFEYKDIISWNSMISAYAKHGDWSHCFKLYNQMKYFKIRPDQITFIGLLTACVNSGLVKEGLECFREMIEIYGCELKREHYDCMVNLLGRSGQLKDATELIRSMPFEPDVRMWGSLLCACKMHSDTRLAEFAAEKLIEMEPKSAGNYVMLSNIFAAAGKWDDVAKMRRYLRERGLKKSPGCSWIEVHGHVHEFRAEDRSHPKEAEIYSMLWNLELGLRLKSVMT